MKTLSKVLAILAAVLLLFALLVGGIYGIFANKEWVKKEYNKLDIESQTGWDSEYCTYVLGSMMDYSVGKLETLEDIKLPASGEEDAPAFFNEDELSHMVDVRALTLMVLRLGLAALIVGFALYAVVFFTERARGMTFFSKAFLIALGVLLLIIAALAIWMAIDFDSFWEAFHHVFFAKQGNWTFDPRVSNMINICPAELFYDFIKHFALIVGLVLLLPILLSVVLVFFGKKSNKRSEDFTSSEIAAVLCYSFALVGMLSHWLTDLRVFRWFTPIGLLAGSLIIIIGARSKYVPKKYEIQSFDTDK